MMNIKKWSFTTLFFVGVLAVVFQSFTLLNFKPKDKFVGLQLYSVRDEMKKDPQATVVKVGEMGYDFVEAAGFNDGKFYGMDPLVFKKLCEDNGLQFLGSHTGQNVPDDTNWDKTMAWWDMAIDAHAAAGVKWIVQPWMSQEGYTSLDGLKRYIKYFNAVGEKCKAKGIEFGYHNHDKEFTTVLEGKPVYDWMLELSNPDNVMFQLDLYWITQGGKHLQIISINILADLCYGISKMLKNWEQVEKWISMLFLLPEKNQVCSTALLRLKSMILSP